MSRNYPIRFINGEPFAHSLGKVVCVGRNYLAHIQELNNAVPDEPVLFIKPASAVVPLQQPLEIPAGDVHFETELALLIGHTLKQAKPEETMSAIAGYGLALDLTRRDIQTKLKAEGLPWEVAKAFDGACPLSEFVPAAQIANPHAVMFGMDLNGQAKQRGDSRLMRHGLAELLAYMSQHFTLEPGDVVLTGTPEGVGPLRSGDHLALSLADTYHFATHVI